MEIHDILGYLLGSSSKLVKRTMDHCLGKYNITTSQWAVIKLLDTKEPLTQTQIANELLGDKATAGEMIQKLYEKEYIEKSLSENDRRAYIIRLTPKAKNVVKEMEKLADEVTKKALEGMSNDDIKILYQSLNQIIINLSKEEI